MCVCDIFIVCLWLQVYDCELEKTDSFGEFLDFCETFDLERGKDDDDEESNIIGQFKVIFRYFFLFCKKRSL